MSNEDDRKYNGWANYETWAVKLWLDNDEYTQATWAERAQEAWDNDKYCQRMPCEKHARWTLRDMLKESHNEDAPTLDGVYGDLLQAALGRVDWDEIAQAMLEDSRREVEN